MTTIALLLAEAPGAPPRSIGIIDLPEVPRVGESVQHAGRGYVVGLVGWNTDSKTMVMGTHALAAIVVQQVSGPPHLKVAGAVPGGLPGLGG